MIELTALTETGLNLNTAVELRKAAAELGIKGASKGRKADLIAEIMKLVEAAKDAKELEAEAAAAQAEAATPKPVSRTKRGICTECGRKEDFRASGLCTACREYAEWENTHSDEGHDDSQLRADVTIDGCPVCYPELDPRKAPKVGKSRAGMVIVAKGDEVHKSNTFKIAAEAAGWIVKVIDSFEGTEGGMDPRYVATATRGADRIVLAWNGRAYDYPNSGATINGKVRKVRNLKEALRIL